jgi:hypothetical protein
MVFTSPIAILNMDFGRPQNPRNAKHLILSIFTDPRCKAGVSVVKHTIVVLQRSCLIVLQRVRQFAFFNAIIKESGNSEVLSDKQLQKKIQRLEAPATGNGGRKPRYLIIFVERTIISNVVVLQNFDCQEPTTSAAFRSKSG